MKKEAACVVLFATLLMGCSSEPLKGKLCANENYLDERILHSFLGKSRGGKLLIYRTIKGDRINQYTVNIINKRYTLQSDSLEYTPEITGLINNPAAYIEILNKQLDGLGIKEYNGEPDKTGILSTLYLKNGDILFRIQDLSLITYPETLKQIRTSKPICANWYVLAE